MTWAQEKKGEAVRFSGEQSELPDLLGTFVTGTMPSSVCIYYVGRIRQIPPNSSGQILETSELVALNSGKDDDFNTDAGA